MAFSRRSLLGTGPIAFATSGSMLGMVQGSRTAAAQALDAQAERGRGHRSPFLGYGNLEPDPAGILDLPHGFRYAMFSVEGEVMSDGNTVPSAHDGMAVFSGTRGHHWLVRNHELKPKDIVEDGLHAVAKTTQCYDPEAVGGTSTLIVDRHRRLVDHRVSLSGTVDNCAGGPTPWNTWLTCEEDLATLAKPHGYVFEVDPVHGGNPEPIVAMGRFEHEAVAFDFRGRAYLTEDADGPHGMFYRFRPRQLHGGLGSLHAGGRLQAMSVRGLADTDLSAVQIPGSIWQIDWVDVPNPNPSDDETPVREQMLALGCTPVPKCEGTWTALDGAIWFVSSRGDGPDEEDEDDRSAAAHAGQIWRYDPKYKTIQLMTLFHRGNPFDEPDNITAGPHGFALACTDGDDDQWLVGINDGGGTFAFAFNAENDEEFAGACFSADGRTLFVNIQGPPARTFAIWGPWHRHGGL